jgi:hypothetical protein
MSVNPPPNPNVATFNNLYWLTFDAGADGLTEAEADLLYLKFPVAQGTEDLQAIAINGVTTAYDDIFVADGTLGTSSINQTTTLLTITAPAGGSVKILPSITFADGSIQTTAAGGGSILATNNTFTGTNAFNNAAPITSIATQPASNDSSTTIPTTAWVQGAITAGGGGGSILATNNTFTGTNAFNNAAPITSIATQPASNDSSTTIPTTAWVQGAITAAAPASILGTNNTFTGTNAFNNAAPITSTATQPASNDNSTKIPTTAWVQGAITAAAPAGDLVPNSVTITSANVNNPSAGITNVWNNNAALSFYGYGGVTSTSVYIQDWGGTTQTTSYSAMYEVEFFFWSGSDYGYCSCILVLFPNRWITGWDGSDTLYNINNKIDGNGDFDYTNSTYSPAGRQYWTYNQKFTGPSSTFGYLKGTTSVCRIMFALPDNTYYWSGSVRALNTQDSQDSGRSFNIHL